MAVIYKICPYCGKGKPKILPREDDIKWVDCEDCAKKPGMNPHESCPPNAPCGMEASDGKTHGECKAPKGSE